MQRRLQVRWRNALLLAALADRASHVHGLVRHPLQHRSQIDGGPGSEALGKVASAQLPVYAAHREEQPGPRGPGGAALFGLRFAAFGGAPSTCRFRLPLLLRRRANLLCSEHAARSLPPPLSPRCASPCPAPRFPCWPSLVVPASGPGLPVPGQALSWQGVPTRSGSDWSLFGRAPPKKGSGSAPLLRRLWPCALLGSEQEPGLLLAAGDFLCDIISLLLTSSSLAPPLWVIPVFHGRAFASAWHGEPLWG